MPKKQTENKNGISGAGTAAKYRYYCHGCTRNAYYSDRAEEGRSITCPHCGLVQTAKAENYLVI